LNLFHRYRMSMREPLCEGGHLVGEYDPNGGWWCSKCEALIARMPLDSEIPIDTAPIELPAVAPVPVDPAPMPLPTTTN
jgi:hypothetical protein